MFVGLWFPRLLYGVVPLLCLPRWTEVLPLWVSSVIICALPGGPLVPALAPPDVAVSLSGRRRGVSPLN